MCVFSVIDTEWIDGCFNATCLLNLNELASIT